MPRKALYGFALIGMQIALLALLLEVGVRGLASVRPDIRRLLYTSTTATGYEEVHSTQELLEGSMLGFKPGGIAAGFVLNSRGFRTREYSALKPAGVFRVVILGDSFTFASGELPWSLSWPVRFEQQLASHCACPVEVLSLGIPGIGLPFEKRLWELEGRQLQPDLVLLAFYVGNDFTDESGATQLDPGDWESGLLRVSQAARLARNWWRVRSQPIASAETNAPEAVERPTATPSGRIPGSELPDFIDQYDPQEPTFSAELFLEKSVKRSRLYQRDFADGFQKLASRATSLIAEISQSVQTTGARFGVLLIPDELQVSRELQQAVLAESGQSADEFDLARPQRILMAACREWAIPCIDALPAFQRHAGEGPLYRLRNTHWNPRGNALAATELARGATEHGLTP